MEPQPVLSEEPKKLFLKSSVFLVLFFVLTPVALIISTFALMTVTATNSINQEKVLAAQIEAENAPRYKTVFAANTPELSKVSVSAEIADARVELVRQYLVRYNSPMQHLAEFIVKTADKNGIDFRLTTAIAQQESNLCKRIPEGTYNCWGWGIHSRGTLGFQSFEEGIETVSKGLRENYIDKGYTTPDEIMRKYTPSSNGSWANGVNMFMSDMQ